MILHLAEKVNVMGSRERHVFAAYFTSDNVQIAAGSCDGDVPLAADVATEGVFVMCLGLAARATPADTDLYIDPFFARAGAHADALVGVVSVLDVVGCFCRVEQF